MKEIKVIFTSENSIKDKILKNNSLEEKNNRE